MKPSTYHCGRIIICDHQFYFSDDFVSDQSVPISGLDVLGGSEINGNGFDQSFDSPDFVPELNKRNHVPVDSVSLPKF